MNDSAIPKPYSYRKEINHPVFLAITIEVNLKKYIHHVNLTSYNCIIIQTSPSSAICRAKAVKLKIASTQ